MRAEFHLVISVSFGGIVIQMGLAIQLDHRFGSKRLLNKFQWFGSTESYAETQRYKYCFLASLMILAFLVPLVMSI